MKKIQELRAIKVSDEIADPIQFEILRVLKELLFFPIINEINKKPKQVLKNANEETSTPALVKAITDGRVYFYRGQFKGEFTSAISKDLRKLGATWDGETRTFNLQATQLPIEVSNAISTSSATFASMVKRIDRKLSQLVPAEIAEAMNFSQIFEKIVYKVDQDITDSIKAGTATKKQMREAIESITITPKLSEGQSRQISEEYNQNLKLDIKGFTEQEIIKLRATIEEKTMKGERLESIIKSIQDTFQVSQTKAKFLARQETRLMTTKLKEVRYLDAGLTEYKWRCVVGSKAHPVRDAHKKLDGKTFSWNNPPITTEPGQPIRRNNPGQDFNCRCTAVPIVRFDE